MGSNKTTVENSLGHKFPQILTEWDYTKNKKSPYDFAVHSTKKVWWRCSKGHDWQARIQARTRKNRETHCPFCSGYRASKENNLAVLSPQLMEEWDYLRNDGVNPFHLLNVTAKKVWWKCKKGHGWEAQVASRTMAKNGCPYCANVKVCMDNCLATKSPQLTKEWNYSKNKLTPADVVPNSGKKIWWKCVDNHEWEATVAHRSRGEGCPYCCNKKVCNKTSLANVNPLLTLEWHPLKNAPITPDMVFPSSNKKAWWKCGSGHEWAATIGSRNDGCGCPFCCKQGVTLINGARCSSLVEAFFYLSFLEDGLVEGKDFYHDKLYCCNQEHKTVVGKIRYDFYFPNKNEYLEVSGYSSKNGEFWGEYMVNIIFKYTYVKNILKSKFSFIQKELTKKEKLWVKSFQENKECQSQ